MIFKGIVKRKIKTGALFIDNGYGVDSYMPNPIGNYSNGDIIYSQISRVSENKLVKINSFDELNKKHIYKGTVVEERYNGVMVDIEIEENGFIFDKNSSLVEGDIVLVKLGRISDDNFYFLNEVSQYNISVNEVNIERLKENELRKQNKISNNKQNEKMKKSWRNLELEIKYLLQADFNNLTLISISKIKNKIIPFLRENKRLEEKLSCLGNYCPQNLLKKISLDIQSNEGDIQRIAYLQMGNLLATRTESNDSIKLVMKQISFLYNDTINPKSFNRLNRPLGALAMGIWGNEKFIHSLNNIDSNYIHILLGIIEERYKRLPHDIKYHNDKNNILKDRKEAGMLTVPFRNNNELLFGLLMLRGKDNDLFKAGGARILKIADKIIEIDKIFMAHGHECKSRFNFELSKDDDKDRDHKISKFVYILNSYLTGEDVSSRIKIKDISIDD